MRHWNGPHLRSQVCKVKSLDFFFLCDFVMYVGGFCFVPTKVKVLCTGADDIIWSFSMENVKGIDHVIQISGAIIAWFIKCLNHL